MDRDIKDYTKRQLERGFSHKEVKKTLLKAGHKKEDVEEALEHISTKHPHLKPSKTWLRGIYVLVIIIILGIGVFFSIQYKLSAKPCGLTSKTADLCYSNLAFKEKNTSHCEAIKSFRSFIACRESVIDYGKEASDILVCKGDYVCIVNIASEKDKTICEGLRGNLFEICGKLVLTDDELASVIIPIITGNVTTPESLLNYDLAKIYLRPSFCSKIEPDEQLDQQFASQEYALSIKDRCFLTISYNIHDQSICTSIESSDWQKICSAPQTNVNCDEIPNEKLRKLCTILKDDKRIDISEKCKPLEGDFLLYDVCALRG